MKNDDIIVRKQYFPLRCTRSVVINAHCILLKFISITKCYISVEKDYMFNNFN